MTSEITWTGTPDDQTARIGDYILRAEDMGEWFWFAVYFKDEQIVDRGTFSMSKAKTACEKAYYEHLKTR